MFKPPPIKMEYAIQDCPAHNFETQFNEALDSGQGGYLLFKEDYYNCI